MKFGLFTSGYQRLPLEKCFTDAAQLGYDYIELWGGYPHAFAPDVIEDYREIRRLQEHYGIPVPVYTPEHNAYPYNYMLGTEKQWPRGRWASSPTKTVTGVSLSTISSIPWKNSALWMDFVRIQCISSQ